MCVGSGTDPGRLFMSRGRLGRGGRADGAVCWRQCGRRVSGSRGRCRAGSGSRGAPGGAGCRERLTAGRRRHLAACLLRPVSCLPAIRFGGFSLAAPRTARSGGQVSAARRQGASAAACRLCALSVRCAEGGRGAAARCRSSIRCRRAAARCSCGGCRSAARR